MGIFGHIINEVIIMNFVDEEHKSFFENKLEELSARRKKDVYYRAIIYTLRNL